MKNFSWLFIVFVAALLIQGCAQLQPVVSAEPDYDVGKVAAIEQYAARNNMKVLWINYPQAHKK